MGSSRRTTGNGQDQAVRRAGRAREVGLFRYGLIRAAADPEWRTRQRGKLVRELAEAEHVGPFGDRVRVSRPTLDRWIRAWRAGGFDALVPADRHLEPRTPATVLELAVALKREVPGRTAAQIAVIINEHAPGAAPSPRTLQRHFARLELNTRPDGTPPTAFGRFEADASNDRWTGDALHGPVIGGRKTYLFAFLDDHSRLLTGYRWGHSEDTVRLEAALRAGLASRGVPKVVYLDNGSAMVSTQLLRALAVLGIRLVHSQPGRPLKDGGRSSGSSGPSASSSSSSSPIRRRSPGSRGCAGSTSCSPPGSRPSTTTGSTPRPSRHRWTGSAPTPHPPCRVRRNCLRRSSGRRPGL